MFLHPWVWPAAVAGGVAEHIAILLQDFVTQNLFKKTSTI